ncbi:MAG: cysteine synthase A [Bdellovibrionales bacterium]|nr:cysteine synthase A [Bdellovibrionales bacterium]
MSLFDSIVDTVGNTPMIRLSRMTSGLRADVLLKLEFFNPLGSVKDRIGKSMIEDAIASGALKKGMKVLEPTSGNTGIALAFVCAAKGFPLTLVMPETMSLERRTLLLLLGADLVLTPGPLGMKGAVGKALEMAAADPNFFLTRQFENPANPKIHEQTTAEEIWRDTSGKVDIVVSGVGTGGTISGIGRILKKKKPGVRMVAVEPTESPVISGGAASPHKIQGIGAGFIPKNLDRAIVDQIEKVSSQEAVAMAKRLIREEGVPVGISAGAAMAAALKVASEPGSQGKTLVVIIPSQTDRYLSTVLGQEEQDRAKALAVQTVDPKWIGQISS